MKATRCWEHYKIRMSASTHPTPERKRGKTVIQNWPMSLGQKTQPTSDLKCQSASTKIFMFCSLLDLQCLQQHGAHRRCSMNISGRNTSQPQSSLLPDKSPSQQTSLKLAPIFSISLVHVCHLSYVILEQGSIHLSH